MGLISMKWDWVSEFCFASVNLTWICASPYFCLCLSFQAGDCVLARVLNLDTGVECYVPGILQILPPKSSSPKFYTVVLYTGQQVCTRLLQAVPHWPSQVFKCVHVFLAQVVVVLCTVQQACGSARKSIFCFQNHEEGKGFLEPVYVKAEFAKPAPKVRRTVVWLWSWNQIYISPQRPSPLLPPFTAVGGHILLRKRRKGTGALNTARVPCVCQQNNFRANLCRGTS